jgi:hypothetical protein
MDGLLVPRTPVPPPTHPPTHPHARSYTLAVDIDTAALGIAMENAMEYDLLDSIDFVQCDLMAGLPLRRGWARGCVGKSVACCFMQARRVHTEVPWEHWWSNTCPAGSRAHVHTYTHKHTRVCTPWLPLFIEWREP